MKILTTIPGSEGGYWGSRSNFPSKLCSLLLYSKISKFKNYFFSFCIASKMIFLRNKYDVIVVDGGPMGQFFSWFQSLLYFGKKPTLMLDCLWYVDRRFYVQFLKRLHKKLSAMSVDRFLVWAEHEIDDYSREFGIYKSKFCYVPFHITPKSCDSYDFNYINS
jgi:hypothetical protein